MASPRGSHHLPSPPRYEPSPPRYERGGGHQRDMSPGDKGSPQSRMSPVQKVVSQLHSFYFGVRLQISQQSPSD
jgi:hypothetical protein